MAEIIRSTGTTTSEQYLAKLCEATFLNLWSYPNIFRDQGKKRDGDGKEVTDLLVICGDHVILFSDKTIEFKETANLDVDWNRWCKRAILKSADQIHGAERWLNFPERLFVDSKCSQPLPLEIPSPNVRKVHRIIVALGVSERCKAYFKGGSGSLLIKPALKGDCHTNPDCEEYQPFTVGDVTPDKGFVHVFDDVTLSLILTELNTITDFVNYLTKKEEFIRSGRLHAAAGEEELLCYYIEHFDKNHQRAFVHPSGFNEWEKDEKLVLDEGSWEEFSSQPQYKTKKEADEISHLWDDLITKFTTNMLLGKTIDPYNENFDLRVHEKAVCLMAMESRFRRRILSQQIYDAIGRTEPNKMYIRFIPNSIEEENSSPYVFLQFPTPPSNWCNNYDEYREIRRRVLEVYCKGHKLKGLCEKYVIGIATEPPKYSENQVVSEDLLLIEFDEWSEKEMQEVQEQCDKLGIMQDNKLKPYMIRAWEYPEILKQ